MYCKVQCFPYICANNIYQFGSVFKFEVYKLSKQPNRFINLFFGE